MNDLKTKIIDALKEFGVKEVILEAEGFGAPTIEFASDNERVVMSNADFSAVGL